MDSVHDTCAFADARRRATLAALSALNTAYPIDSASVNHVINIYNRTCDHTLKLTCRCCTCMLNVVASEQETLHETKMENMLTNNENIKIT